MLTGTQEGAQRNIFTTEQICRLKGDVLLPSATYNGWQGELMIGAAEL